MRKGIVVYLLAVIFNFAYLHAKSNTSEILALSQAANQKIVIFTNAQLNWEEKEELIRKAGGQPLQRLAFINAIVGQFPNGMSLNLEDEPTVESVSDNSLIGLVPGIESIAGFTEPKGQEVPWGVARINSPEAWKQAQGRGVKVCIIDSGADLQHQDLKGNVVGGANFSVDGSTTPDDNIQDEQGHGTHVNGIVAAINNATGLVGVAPHSFLYQAKVFGSAPYTTLAAVIAGIEYCASIEAHVANMSLGSRSDNEALHIAVQELHKAGTVIVAAAGNDSGGAVSFPGAYPEVIGVSASNSENKMAYFSSQGPEVDVIAPGESIPSTFPPGDYRDLSGTSMASPHVAGVAALVVSKNLNLTNVQVKSIIELSATNISLPPEQQGKGLANAAKAVEMARLTLPGAALVNIARTPLGVANGQTSFISIMRQGSAPSKNARRAQNNKQALIGLFGN
ncbi:MAG: S8 family peptidase [Elusimicrobia bacterium]|nr:S8 family peptidase [Elusimicrobiota bacterium]